MKRGVSTLEVVYNRAVSESFKVRRMSRVMYERKLFLDLQMHFTFTQYIYKRIAGRNPTKKVFLSDAYIVVAGAHSEDSLYILPIWKSINEPLAELSLEITCAISEIATGKKRNIYLVYPRLGGQMKHITVKSSALEKDKKSYSLKLIPYVCDLTCLLNNQQGEKYNESSSNFLR